MHKKYIILTKKCGGSGGSVLVQQVKWLLATQAAHIGALEGVPVAPFLSQLSANVPGELWETAQALEPWPLQREGRIEFQAPGFSLAQTGWLWSFVE